MRATAEDYARLLQGLRPPGPAWPAPDPLLEALALELARAHGRALDLLEEADPRTAREMLVDWEAQAGLPDACSAGVATTLQERRHAVVGRLTARGGASLGFLQAIADSLGYAVAIEEFRPFVTGRSRCGDRLNGGHIVRHTLRVRVLEARVTLFRTGASACGDRLGKIARAEDLECRLRRVAPAHVELIFAYEGA